MFRLFALLNHYLKAAVVWFLEGLAVGFRRGNQCLKNCVRQLFARR